ncbi:unnamed protein product [Eruca vesicaria subsp. sativa]|uniref:Uncharacterized protein n=1 Tax=Eruca vesicaria subsp. sativa TaxID=29727 RepID=A0ABC8K968_ERUVS|nr:unnamed protein product [Eruca vesicaria subsp. sativa]
MSRDQEMKQEANRWEPVDAHLVREVPSETEEDVSSPADVIQKVITEEKHVQENVNESKDVGKSEETATESKEKETEGKKQEEAIIEKVVEVGETEESDEQKQQAEVAVKQKHSNSIMSKVKQSLVKAKKGIIGKSSSSKTITTEESKEETKGK